MADLQGTVEFKALVAQTSAVLLTHGLEVEPVAVRDVVAHVIDSFAERISMDAEEAIHLVTPEAVADLIAKAADESSEGAQAVHAVRPVRIDERKVRVPIAAVGRLVMASAQTGKYAVLNQDSRTAAHAADLATELGAALVTTGEPAEAEVPVGLLEELVQLVESVAEHVEIGEWSICNCGVPHEQGELDEKVAVVMRADAALALQLHSSASE